ncbi:MAG: hypothetical protein J5659_00385 [Clostridia bacterium]|nr:hypothetical protein [Clostridia bacterium]
MNNIKKTFALIVSVLICISVLPSFAFADNILLASVSATVTEPFAGEHPDFNIISSEPEKYSVSVSDWYLHESPYPSLTAESIFEGSHSYSLRITFTPLDGYTIDYTTAFTVNGKTTSCYGSVGNREVTFFVPPEVYDISSQSALETALTQKSHISELNIISDFTVDKDCMIYFNGENLKCHHDTVLTVNEGVTLTIGNGGSIGSFWPSYEGDWETPPFPKAKIVNNGTVIVDDGGATKADFDTNNGTIIVKNGGNAVVVNKNYGTVTVESGGNYMTTQGADAQNHGTVIINDGGYMEARFGTSIINCNDGKFVLDGTFRCNSYFDMEGTGHLWFENDGEVEGHGDVIIAAADSEIMPAGDKYPLIEEMMAQLGQEKRFESWDDINILKLEEAATFEELELYLSAERIVAGEKVEGNMDTIVVVTEDVDVPTGKSIMTMGKVIIDSNKRFNICEGALLECSLENHGIINVQNHGKLYTTMGGNIENYTNILICEKAELKSQMGASVINNQGASLHISGRFYCGSIGFDGNDGMWFENSGNVLGDGSIILYEAAFNDMPVKDTAALVQKAKESISGTGDPLLEIRLAGDINGDFTLNNLDIARLFKRLSGWSVETDEKALDTNGDGNTDNRDLTRLFQYLSGWDVSIF